MICLDTNAVIAAINQRQHRSAFHLSGT